MDFLGFAAAIGVLLGVGWIISKIRDGFWSGVNQRVLMRTSHSEGRELVTTSLAFTAATSSAALAKAIEGAVDLPFGPRSAVLGDLYIDSATDSTIDFKSGSRIGTSFHSRVLLREAEGGVSGSYDVVSWTESDGIVSDIAQLKYLRRKIESAVLSLDAAAAIE